jgi:hypothetical protein
MYTRTTIFISLSVVFHAAVLFAGCSTAPRIKGPDTPTTLYYQKAEHAAAIAPQKLTDRTGTENINGSYPDTIAVKSLTQTFCKGYSFMLRNGKIWVKADGDSQWELLLKTGLPFSVKSRTIPNSGWFSSPEEIVEIAADGDCLFAFDGDGRMYNMYTQNSTIEKPFRWVGVFGWPDKVPLTQNVLVRNKRGWSMGVRRKDILWYEDRFGNQHHYGTMGLETLYFLTADGREIRFTDSGLPVDFSHSVTGPERGSFIARNISVSGDTLFLIADDGTMYTRLIDFDTMGCDPMFFKYTYTAEKQPYSGTDYRSNFTPWGLPAEDWKKQPDVPLSGNARITRFISIAQNGRGNAARELRIAGTDAGGRNGYYSKQLNDPEWVFTPALLTIHDDDFLTGGQHTATHAGYTYTEGQLLKNQTLLPGITCSIDDFTLASEGSCTLRIKKGTEEKKIGLYMVEMWTYVVRFNPGLDGTPKHFFVTASVPETELQSADPDFAALLKDMFGDKDKKLFAFSAEATNRYIQIDTAQSARTAYTVFLNESGTKLPPQALKGAALFQQPIIARYEDTSLLLAEKPFYTETDIPAITTIIANNEKYIEELYHDMQIYSEFKFDAGLSRWGYNTVDLITSITLLNQIDFPKIKTMTRFGNQIMNTNARNFDTMYEYRSFTYPHIIGLVQARITAYQALVQSIESGNTHAYLDRRLKLTFPGYFSQVRLPVELTGTSPGTGTPAVLEQITAAPLFPGFILTIQHNGEPVSLFIELRGAAAILYNRPLFRDTADELEKNPLIIPAGFVLMSNTGNPLDPIAGIHFLSKKEGWLTWNGKRLTIKVENHLFGKTTLFKGDTDEKSN